MIKALLRSLPGGGAQVEDWRQVLDEAHRHGVAGPIWAARAALGMPTEVAEAEAERCACERARARYMTELLAEVVGRLEVAGVTAVALKGPALADRLYPPPSFRPCGDLDLLVAADDLDRATRALAPLGYRVGGDMSAGGYRRWHHHLHLCADHAPPVELHFLPSSELAVTFSTEALIARSQPHELRVGGCVHVLDPADELVYLAVHAASSWFERLGWLYDLAALGAAHPVWAEAAARARAVGALEALRATADALRARLGVAIDDDALAPSGRLRAATRSLLTGLTERHAPGRWQHTVAKNAHALVLCDGPRRAARHARRAVAVIAERRVTRLRGRS